MELDYFTITAILNGRNLTVKIQAKPDENGLNNFTCFIEDILLSQLCKINQIWEQIQGCLNDNEVKSLGNAIDNAFTRE